ncbi:hypothetical protein FRC05_004960, partial [Tulasnella sp. 425]
MDKNEDVARKLAYHTSKLSGYLEHIKKKSDAEQGDNLAMAIYGLHSIQERVSRWDSLGRFKKASLASDHAADEITSVVFSPDRKVLASASWNDTVQLWDGRTGARLGNPLTRHTDSITSVVFSPDSEVLASASSDNTVRLWNVRAGAQLGEPLTGHTDSVTSVVFSLDGKILASASEDNRAQLWDTRSGARMGDPLAGYTGSIKSVFNSPNRTVLTSKSADGTIRPLDTLTYQISAGILSILIAHHITFKSNWILCGSKRLLWLPVHYRSLEQDPTLEIHLAYNRLALVFHGKLSIIDVSESSTFWESSILSFDIPLNLVLLDIHTYLGGIDYLVLRRYGVFRVRLGFEAVEVVNGSLEFLLKALGQSGLRKDTPTGDDAAAEASNSDQYTVGPSSLLEGRR